MSGWVTIARILLLFSLVGLSPRWVCNAAESEGSNTEVGPTIFLRRMFVPANDHASWPRGDHRYLPIDVEEYERLIRSLVTIADGTPGNDAQIVRATYTARFQKNRLAGGIAEIKIRDTGDSASMLSLSGCRLAIEEMWWEGADRRGAVFGLSAEELPVVLTDPSNELRMRWTLRGTVNDEGGSTFQIALPVCPWNRLSLDLPSEFGLVSDQGIVTGPFPIPPSVHDSDSVVNPAENDPTTKVPANHDLANDGTINNNTGNLPVAESWQRWHLDLGGKTKAVIRIGPLTIQGEQRQVWVRTSSNYQLSSRGLELSERLLLDVQHEPLRQVVVGIEKRIRLTGVHLRDRELPWTIAKEPENDFAHAIIELPDSLMGNGHLLELTAMAPLTDRKSYPLPRCSYPDFVWQEGDIELMVAAPLVLKGINIQGGHQSRLSRLSDESGEIVEFQLHASDAQIDVVLANQAPGIAMASGRHVNLGENFAEARLVVDLKCNSGDEFLMVGEVSDFWNIEEVETEPPDLLDDWRTTVTGPGQKRLEIRFDRPLSSEEGVRLVIVGRRTRGILDRQLTMRDIEVVRFHGVDQTESLVALRTEPPFRIRLIGDSQVIPLRDSQITADQRTRLEPQLGDIVFRDDANAQRLHILLSREPARISVDLNVEATIRKESLLESYSIHCDPGKAFVDRLVVDFSESRPESLRWQIETDEEIGQSVNTRRLPVPEEVDSVHGETWEIALRRPYNEPFVLRASRWTDNAGLQPLSLAAVRGATENRATLTLFARDGVRPVISHSGALTVVPAAPVRDDGSLSVHARFRYDPERDVRAAAGTPIQVRVAEHDSRPLVWIWSLEHLSCYSGSGEIDHQVILCLQNDGESELSLRLPDGIQILQIMVDDSEIVRSQTIGTSNDLEVALPTDVRFPTVVLEYSTKQSSLGAIRTIAAPTLSSGVPVLNQRWTVWLPPEYRPFSTRGRGDESRSWGTRLFGPLWRNSSPAGRVAWAVDQVPLQLGQQDAGVPPFEGKFPWTAAASHENRMSIQAGWSKHIRKWTEGQVLEVTVYHRSTMTALAWVCFLLTALMTRMYCARCWVVWWSAIGCAIALTLLLPDSGVPIATGVFLGLLSGAIISCLLDWIQSQANEDMASSANVTDFPEWRQAVMLLAVFCCLLNTAIAQDAVPTKDEPPSVKEPASPDQGKSPSLKREKTEKSHKVESSKNLSEIHSVLIPVDESLQPAGDKYFIPEPLYLKLYRLAATTKSVPQGWVLRGASYELSLDWQDGAHELEVQEMQAIFDVEVFDHDVRVAVPLAKKNVNLIDSGARIEGVTIPVQWNEFGKSFSFTIAEPGSYQVQLSFRPSLQQEKLHQGFELGIPPLLNSQLLVQHPDDAGEIDISSAIGAMTRDLDPNRILSNLGPTDRLHVRWSRDAETGVTESVEVDELFWLSIRPDSVVLDARFHVRRKGSQLPVLRLVADPRLRLVNDDRSEVVLESNYLLGSPQEILLEVGDTDEDTVEVRAQFLIVGTSGIGHLRIPRLDIASGYSQRRWFAVTVDEDLGFDEPDSVNVEPLAIPEFLRRWGSAESEPQLAFQSLPRGEDLLRVNTWLQNSKTTGSAEQTINYGYPESRVMVKYQLVTEPGYVFQHRIRVPSELAVDDVRIHVKQSAVTSRWSRTEPDLITVFLMSAMSGPYELLLKGHLAMASSESEVAMPQCSIEGVEITEQSFHVARQAGVAVSVHATQGLKPQDIFEKSVVGHDWGERIASFVTSGEGPVSVQLNLELRQPELTVTQLTQLHKRQDEWSCEIDYRMNVNQGIVDVIRFDVPPTLVKPLTIEPIAQYELIELPHTGRQRLIVRLPKSVEDQCELKIVAAIKPNSDGRIRVPEVKPLDIDHLTRYVAVPSRSDRRRIQWEIRSLQESELPEGLLDLVETEENIETYQVSNDDFGAVLSSDQYVARIPQIRLVDIHVACREDRQCFGTVTFDLEPAGLSSCHLKLAPGHELCLVRVAELPAQIAAVGDNLWRVQLGPDQLPQRIDVVFTGALVHDDHQAGVWKIPAPQLTGLPVRRSLWTVLPAPDAETALLSLRRIPAEQQDVFRLRSLESLIDLPVHVVAGRSLQDLQYWSQRWGKRLLSLKPSAADDSSESRTALMSKLLNLERLIRENSGTPALPEGISFWQQGAKEKVARTEIVRLWKASTATSPVIHAMARGESISIKLRIRSRSGDDLASRIFATIVVIVTITVGIGLREKFVSGIVGTVSQWLPLATLAMGLAWWFWFEPRLLGLVIVAISLIYVIRLLFLGLIRANGYFRERFGH